VGHVEEFSDSDFVGEVSAELLSGVDEVCFEDLIFSSEFVDGLVVLVEFGDEFVEFCENDGFSIKGAERNAKD
jgi:hypothetical protein